MSVFKLDIITVNIDAVLVVALYCSILTFIYINTMKPMFNSVNPIHIIIPIIHKSITYVGVFNNINIRLWELMRL